MAHNSETDHFRFPPPLKREMEFLFLLFCLGVPKNATYEREEKWAKKCHVLEDLSFPSKKKWRFVTCEVKGGFE